MRRIKSFKLFESNSNELLMIKEYFLSIIDDYDFYETNNLIGQPIESSKTQGVYSFYNQTAIDKLGLLGVGFVINGDLINKDEFVNKVSSVIGQIHNNEGYLLKTFSTENDTDYEDDNTAIHICKITITFFSKYKTDSKIQKMIKKYNPNSPPDNYYITESTKETSIIREYFHSIIDDYNFYETDEMNGSATEDEMDKYEGIYWYWDDDVVKRLGMVAIEFIINTRIIDDHEFMEKINIIVNSITTNEGYLLFEINEEDDILFSKISIKFFSKYKTDSKLQKFMMKYSKNAPPDDYYITESIHPLNTNVTTLDANFVYDITNMITDLFDDLNIEDSTDYDNLTSSGATIHFYSPYFRKKFDTKYGEYPSINIKFPFKGFSEVEFKFSDVKDTIFRIKDYLGDSYIACLYSRFGHYSEFKIDPKLGIEDTSSYNLSILNSQRFNFEIDAIEIVYDPKSFEN